VHFFVNPPPSGSDETRPQFVVLDLLFLPILLPVLPLHIANRLGVALRLFGRGLPPVASADVTMRYWRPQVTGEQALVIGYSRPAADFCTGYRLVARISTPDGSDERGQPIARCTLRGTLAQVWPRIVERSD
jgi:hypothetical protein